MAETSPLRRRMIEGDEGSQSLAGDAAILRPRGVEVQPVFRPMTLEDVRT